MNTSYQMYQAERTMSAAEQRAADRGAAELVRFLGDLWRSAAAPFRRARRTRQPGPFTGHGLCWGEVVQPTGGGLPRN